MDRQLTKSKWKNWRIGWCALGLLIIGLAGWAGYMGRQKQSLRVSEEHLMVTTVARGDFQEYVPVTGTMIPIRTHYLDSIEGGRVEAVYREAGSIVAEGDEILKLANTNLLLDIMYREAELFEQSNNLRNTQITIEQNRLRLQRELLDLDYEIDRLNRTAANNTELLKENLIAQQSFEATEQEMIYLERKRALLIATQQQDSLFRAQQVVQLASSLERMEANLALVRQNLDNLTIRAPVSGQLTAMNAEIGQSKGRGERLGQIDILDGFKIRAAVDEHYGSRISQGQAGSFTFEDQIYELRIEKVYPEIVHGRFAVDLFFNNSPPPGVRRGQTFHLRISLGECDSALLLGTGSFYQTTGGNWAFIVDEASGVAEKQSIVLGRRNTQFYEVLEGLAPGDRVIVSSYSMFGEAERLLLR
jgi:HlyD family secretion protein